MNASSVKKITIVGGGSSGWMAAIYLNKLLNHSAPNFHIQVIESPDIGIIGVGEATVHSIRFFFAAMGLDERELMAETNATFKNGIMFRNWMQPVNGATHEYFHPFEANRAGKVMDISSTWFLNKRYQQERYDQGVCLSSHLIAQGHCPKSAQSRPYQGVVPYGYHLDATLLARFLRRKAVAAGVEHIEATVTAVAVKDDCIASITANNTEYRADFFLDCTGFRGLLIEKLRENNWVSFEDALPCNKAVAIQRDLPAGSPKPYTTATALSNGWAWQIDLVNRQGTGYVYDGNRISPETAERELREFLGVDAKILKSVHLDMKVGCRKEFWIGNCVALGLAGGFIEPLESTGLHLINLGVGLLATHLANPTPPQALKDSYNHLMNGFYQDLKQFIVLHYCLTDRRDTEFWREAATKATHCEKLPKLLELWRYKICEFHDLAGSFSTIFGDENYRYVLYGMQHYPQLSLQLEPQAQELIFAELRGLVNQALMHSSPQREYLQKLRPETVLFNL